MNIKKNKANVEIRSDVDICNFLLNILSKKQFGVLKRRYGINSSRETLESIAQHYDVTRERIRQIESRALEECRLEENLKVFHTYLAINANDQTEIAFGGARVILKSNVNKRKNLLSGLYRLSIDVVYQNISNWLNNSMEPFEKEGQYLGWFNPNTETDVRHQIVINSNISSNVRSSIQYRIENTLRQAEWPVAISTIQNSLPDISEANILQSLKLDFDAEFENDEISVIRKLRTSTRVIMIMRYAKKPLNTKHVQDYDRKLFGCETSTHYLGAILGRSKEVLIVDRGTYVLWEYIKISSSAVEHIRNVSAKQLNKIGEFLSCKVLLRRINTALTPEVSSQLTNYMLHGICKDDSRFITRRGLMIGLTRKDFNQSFISLTELIHNVVEKKGPISIADINKQISECRDVFDANIHAILKKSSTIVSLGSGFYDITERDVGDTGEVDKLK